MQAESTKPELTLKTEREEEGDRQVEDASERRKLWLVLTRDGGEKDNPLLIFLVPWFRGLCKFIGCAVDTCPEDVVIE